MTNKIVSLEYSSGAKGLDAGIYTYEVDGKNILKIDFPDSNGFMAVHEKDDKTVYIKADYMKFTTK